MKHIIDPISQIRSFNRFYTNVLGLLDQYILDSGYSLTEARVLLEISKKNHCTANNLADHLKIDHSYMSRILRHFEKDSLITRVQAAQDRRLNFIVLSEKGSSVIENLNQKSNEQILHLIKNLNPNEVADILDSMQCIKTKISEALEPITIRDFIPTDIDYIISRHQSLYQAEYNLSPIFSSYVAQSIHDFAKNFDASKECLLIATIENHPIGSIAIAKTDNQTAQLRYYLLEPETRGKGVGHRLVDMALLFCQEKGYTHVFLETISALKTARHIYQSKGFKITATHKNPEWGNDILEERWDLML